MASPYDDAVRHAIENNDFQEAIEILVLRYQDAILRYCTLMTGRIDLGEDIAQEVFLAAAHSLKTFEWKSSLETWLMAIARNTTFNHFRDLERRSVLSRDFQNDIAQRAHRESPEDPENYFLSEEQSKLIYDGLQKIRPRDRELIALRNSGELSFRQMSEVFQISADALRQQYRRAIQSLREQVEKEIINSKNDNI